MNKHSFYFLATSTGARPDLVEGLLTSFNELVLPAHASATLFMLDQAPAVHAAIFERHVAKSDRYIRRICVENVMGLSKARNLLLNQLKGDGYVMFCDDDASYPAHFLSELDAGLNVAGRPDIAVFRLLNAGQDSTYGNRKYPTRSRGLGRSELINIGISLNLAMSLQRLRSLGGFNEDYGVGSRGLCGEETELLLRCLDADATAVYLSAPFAYHPSQSLSVTNVSKLYDYSRGYRDMLLAYHGSFALRVLVRAHLMMAICRSVVALVLRKAERPNRLVKLRGLLGLAAVQQ